MDLRVDVVRRGAGGTTIEELAMLEAWGKELFAPDQNVIDEFEWHNGQGIGFNIQTYDRDEFVSFANVSRKCCTDSDVGLFLKVAMPITRRE